MSKTQPLKIADAATGLRHVFIRDMELPAQIGVYRHEEGKTQPICINVDMAVEDLIDLSDELNKVVDYGVVEQKIRGIVAEGHIRLAETLAERIALACFEDARVVCARVRVEKLHALPGAKSAGVEIERVRAFVAG